MLTATDISIKYGERVLLDHLNFVIKDKDRVGLVGRNGAGKSTMLKVPKTPKPHLLLVTIKNGSNLFDSPEG